ncbi:acyl-CoA thioesterase [Hylemonella gracilis str. Niagara R]|uniref:Acyl-CoA thioesterase n=2 Tax=Hylemonella gracilis TaxID=80880 RepID=A0A016XFL7_9BURK|nr:thioesterase family protein [Hylemonella gracilis]EYC50367.1 acyl-CoA thioesterase [Hylemonella gracilis str. Niagara R]
MATMHAFDAALRLNPIGQDRRPARFAGHTSDDYWNMVGPFGGCTAAVVLAAILRHPDLLGAPLSITVNYAAALTQGPFEVQVLPARTNRSTQHWTAAIVQNDEEGQAQIVTTATAVTAVRRETWSMSDRPMPQVPAPAELPTRGFERAMAWLGQYEMRPVSGSVPDTWDDRLGADSTTRLWIRDQPPRPLDFCSLLACSDVFFPRVWLRRATYTPAGTVSITTYFHASAQELKATGVGWLLGQASAQEFRNGFFDQSAQLWNEAGVLLATSHQIVYYKA